MRSRVTTLGVIENPSQHGFGKLGEMDEHLQGYGWSAHLLLEKATWPWNAL